MPSINEQKFAFVQELLTLDSVSLVIDASHPDVEVPADLKSQKQLVLTIGYNLPIPIVGLGTTVHGVHGTLSFNHIPHTCFIPWEALWGVTVEGTGNSFAWEDSIPEEIKHSTQERLAAYKKRLEEEGSAMADYASDRSEGQQKKPSPFTVVDGGSKDVPASKNPEDKPNLKLVN